MEPGKPISVSDSNSCNDDLGEGKLGFSGLQKDCVFSVLEEQSSVLEGGEFEKIEDGFAKSTGYVCVLRESENTISSLALNLDFPVTKVVFSGLENNGVVHVLEERGFELNQLLDYELRKSMVYSSILLDCLEKLDNFEFGVRIDSTQLENSETEIGRLEKTEEIQNRMFECGSSSTTGIEDGSLLTVTAGFEESKRIEDDDTSNSDIGFDEFKKTEEKSEKLKETSNGLHEEEASEVHRS